MSNGLLFIGMEKNNDDSKQHYFSSNKHDAAGEIIRCKARLEMLRNGIRGFSSCERTKQPYEKQNYEYCNGGGIQEARRTKRQHPEE